MKIKITAEVRELTDRLESIYEQIKHYPTPIAGSDEQFNYLLSERNRLAKELSELRRSAGLGLGGSTES